MSRCFGCLLGWIGRWEACRAPELSLRPSSRGFPQGGQPGPVCSCSQQHSRPAPWCQRGARCQGLARGHPSCMCWVQPRVRAAPAWLVDMDMLQGTFHFCGSVGKPIPHLPGLPGCSPTSLSTQGTGRGRDPAGKQQRGQARSDAHPHGVAPALVAAWGRVPGAAGGLRGLREPGGGAGARGRRGGGAEMLEEPAAFPPHP